MSYITCVDIPVKEEINNANAQITSLLDYKTKNWGIGLNGKTLDPDNFLAFFSERNLPFECYVRCVADKGAVSIGDSKAYDSNIATLDAYISRIRKEEVEAVNGKISELLNSQTKNWAIGVNSDGTGIDSFPLFFDLRNVSFYYYAMGAGFLIGNSGAYDKNINGLKSYLNSLPNSLKP